MTKQHILRSDVHVIEPAKGLRLVNPFELWRWRDLFVALMVRDLALRYKQTVLGVAWVVVQPLATVAIFSFLLGKIGNVPAGGLPYPLFAFAAMVPWQVFSRTLMGSGMSLVSNRPLVTKVYFAHLDSRRDVGLVKRPTPLTFLSLRRTWNAVGASRTRQEARIARIATI